MSADNQRPIIIKKIKKGGGDGHHGGAWKVAYADFVTAMMAFFLLMWLLNATTEVQRKGIADYFNPTIPINRVSGGGEGAFGGDSIFSEETLAKHGTGAAQQASTESLRARGETGSEQDPASSSDGEQAKLEGLQELLTGRAGESMVSNDVHKHVTSKITDEGLVIELFDLPDSPLFDPESSEPNQVLVELIDLVSSILALETNEIAVSGYTSALPVVVANNPVWDVSTGRAEIVRQLLEAGALPPRRIQRVTGYADRKPVVENPLASRNNRIEVILLREVK